jgi:hypothetical protein
MTTAVSSILHRSLQTEDREMAGKYMKHESRNAAWTLGKMEHECRDKLAMQKEKWYPDEAEMTKDTCRRALASWSYQLFSPWQTAISPR